MTKAIEQAAEAVHKLRLHTDVICRLGEDVTEQLNRLEDNMRVLRVVDKSPELTKVADRLARIRELRNMMELGDLHIRMTREIGEAWRRLP